MFQMQACRRGAHIDVLPPGCFAAQRLQHGLKQVLPEVVLEVVPHVLA
jgi:hypothetical protein